MNQEWCEHLEHFPGRPDMVRTVIGQRTIEPDWKFCPICGKPIPKPKQPVLEEKFHLIFLKHDKRYGSKEEWLEAIIKDLAKTAIDAVEEVIDEAHFVPLVPYDKCYETFKKEIREKLL